MDMIRDALRQLGLIILMPFLFTWSILMGVAFFVSLPFFMLFNKDNPFLDGVPPRDPLRNRGPGK